MRNKLIMERVRPVLKDRHDVQEGMPMEDGEFNKLQIATRMLALYVPLKQIPDGNPAVKKAIEAYLALEKTLESVLNTRIRNHPERDN